MLVKRIHVSRVQSGYLDVPIQVWEKLKAITPKPHDAPERMAKLIMQGASGSYTDADGHERQWVADANSIRWGRIEPKVEAIERVDVDEPKQG